jgi:mRNA interferase MazF
MRRGEVWTVSAAGYAGKPRPALILQDDLFPTAPVTIAPLTTADVDAPLFRIPILASEGNGLDEDSRVMLDKITTVPRAKVGQRLGALTSAEMLRVNRSVAMFLGLGSR